MVLNFMGWTFLAVDRFQDPDFFQRAMKIVSRFILNVILHLSGFSILILSHPWKLNIFLQMFRNGGDIVCYIFSVLGDTFCFELLKLPVTLQQIYD